MTSGTRATLLNQLRDGSDPLAWNEFFQRYWPMIYAFARRRGCSEHTAEEIVQEVLLRVFRNRDVFQYDPAQGRFRDWLGTLVRNQVAEYFRRPAQRIKPRGGSASGSDCQPSAPTPTPEETWENIFESSLLLTLLDVVRCEMNPRDYLAFELFSLQQMKAAEVARVTGMTRNVVYKTHRKVLKRLRQLAGTYRDDGKLHERIGEAMRSQPSPLVQRSVTVHIEATQRNR